MNNHNNFIIPGYEPDPLFGPVKRTLPPELYFIYLWNNVELELGSTLNKNRETFLPGSCCELRDFFLKAALDAWYNVADSVVQSRCGAMPANWKTWLTKTVLPAMPEIHDYLCRNYAVYKRQTKELIRYTTDFIREVMEDITNNRQRVASSLLHLDDSDDLKISKIQLTGSDRHNHGRCVLLIEFQNGKKVLWKPRSMMLDRTWNSWLDWLCTNAGYPLFTHINSFDTKYGSFCSYIEYIPVSDKNELHDYFRNFGFLMGAVFILKGNDIHAENVIACGKHPVIVDSETVISVSNPFSEVMSHLYSLDQTAFLPFITPGPGIHYSICSICSDVAYLKNLPVFEDRRYSGYDYKEDVMEGFRSALNVCIRQPVAASDKASELFNGCTFRYLIRPTNSYAIMLKYLSKADHLISENHFHSALSILDRGISFIKYSQTEKRILEEEKKALSSLDIPAFYYTIQPEDCQKITQRIVSLSDTLVETCVSEIDFLLCRHSASESTEKQPSCHMQTHSLECISTTVVKLCECLTSRRCILVQRSGLTEYISCPFPPMLEGDFGAVIALSSYTRLARDEKADSIINRFVASLEEHSKMFSAGIVSSEPGLCEGVGGFLTGLVYLLQMNLISIDLFRSYLDRISKIGPLKNTGDRSLCYGSAGLLFGLNKVPAEILNTYPYLKSCQNTLSEQLAAFANAKNNDHDVIYGIPGIRFALGELSFHDLFEWNQKASSFTDNMSFLNGMSGKLYDATSQRIKKGKKTADSYEKLCAAALLGADKPASLPHLCIPGLLFGEAGRLYSYVRFLSPSEIPDIF